MGYMEELSVTEAENLKKTITRLFRQTCMIQMRYDPVTLTPRDNPDYELCVRHKGFIEDFLAVLGCELEHDPQEHIFRLKGEGVETEKISLTSTVIILLVKMIYREKIMGEGLNATVTNLEEIREYGKNTNLLNRKLTGAEWREALYLMNRHQMIELPGAVRDVEDQTPIYLYSTVNLYVSAADINELIEEYREEAPENETIEEIISADAAE
ncbi:MAG: DUF4194 domain-containing protein [Dorea sp.]|nr:DUF4194 domain-containing protein [Dorea sp.]